MLFGKSPASMLLALTLLSPCPALAQNDNHTKSDLPVSIKYFYKFPAKIEAVKSESVVGVVISFERLNEDGRINTEFNNLAGVVIDSDGLILTCYHGLPEYKAVALDESTRVKIFDGHRFFDAKLLAIDWTTDQAMLKVEPLEQNGFKFSKRAVEIPTEIEKNVLAATAESFYVFRFLSRGEGCFIFTARLGPYLIETNVAGKILRVKPLGVLLNDIEGGFSGSPIIGSDGKIYGLAHGSSDIFTYVVTLEEIKEFISKTKEHLKSP